MQGKREEEELTRKEKGKKKISVYGTNKEELDWSNSDTRKNEDRISEMESESTKRALKSANQTLHRSTHQNNHVIW